MTGMLSGDQVVRGWVGCRAGAQAAVAAALFELDWRRDMMPLGDE